MTSSGEWEHAHLLRCQVCGARFTHHAGSAPDLAAAKQAAHTAGWRMASGHWACGGCSRARGEKQRQARGKR